MTYKKNKTKQKTIGKREGRKEREAIFLVVGGGMFYEILKHTFNIPS